MAEKRKRRWTIPILLPQSRKGRSVSGRNCSLRSGLLALALLPVFDTIQQLVGQGEFELIAEESTCPLEKVKTEDGWADEIMAHMIRCKHCGQIFTCVVNTWRGSGHFKKGKG